MIYPENTVVQILLNNSREFKYYYSIERRKITSQITWIKKNDLPSGIDFRTSQINGKHFIFLRKIPPLVDDDLKIAHELQHIFHSDNGMPSLGVKENKFDYLASAINSSIHDLFVYKDLIKYDFDLCKDYIKEQNENIRQLKKISSEPKDELALLKWSFNFASSKLDYEFIKSEYDYEDESYFTWFEAKYPKTTEISVKIKTIVDNIGTDSNEKVGKILKSFIDEFNLGNIMILKCQDFSI